MTSIKIDLGSLIFLPINNLEEGNFGILGRHARILIVGRHNRSLPIGASL